MAYRYDEDLEFLQDLESKDLEQLVEILIYDKDGEKGTRRSCLVLKDIKNTILTI